MYLIFPESMIIPEVAARRADNNFEDWLTAAVIETANQQAPNGAVASSRGITDLWMLEIAKRTGKIWRGQFHVEFNDGTEEQPQNGSTLEEGTGVFSFSLDTATGEMRFTP
jgi:hypothetical protein